MIVFTGASVQVRALTGTGRACCLYTMISFLILGAGGAIPTPERGPAAYWLDLDGHRVLIDPGPGALVRLVRDTNAPDTIDAVDTVLLTHLHLDHCADLAPLLFAMRSPVLANEGPLQLIGPPGLAGYLEKLGELYGHWVVPERRAVNVLEIEPGQAVRPGPRAWTTDGTDGPSITAFAADHSEDRFSAHNLGLVIRDADGRRLVFSGDSGPGGELAAMSRDADLLVVECTTPDEFRMAGHMCPSRLADLCAAAAPRRVVLTHIFPDTAREDLPRLVGARYDGEVVAAVDGDLFKLGDD